MDIFLKSAAAILIAALLCLFLSKQARDFSVLLAVAVCSMVIATAIQYLEPVITLLKSLSGIGNLDASMLKILLKAVSIGLLAEIISLICADAGNATLGKSIQLFGTVMILFLSTPLFTKLIELIESILSAA